MVQGRSEVSISKTMVNQLVACLFSAPWPNRSRGRPAGSWHDQIHGSVRAFGHDAISHEDPAALRSCDERAARAMRHAHLNHLTEWTMPAIQSSVRSQSRSGPLRLSVDCRDVDCPVYLRSFSEQPSSGLPVALVRVVLSGACPKAQFELVIVSVSPCWSSS